MSWRHQQSTRKWKGQQKIAKYGELWTEEKCHVKPATQRTTTKEKEKVHYSIIGRNMGTYSCFSRGEGGVTPNVLINFVQIYDAYAIFGFKHPITPRSCHWIETHSIQLVNSWWSITSGELELGSSPWSIAQHRIFSISTEDIPFHNASGNVVQYRGALRNALYKSTIIIIIIIIIGFVLLEFTARYRVPFASPELVITVSWSRVHYGMQH